jgi:hypothetical protein
MKRGPKEVPIGTLIVWEFEWCRVFYGLAFGIPDRRGFDSTWESPRPPRVRPPRVPEFNAEQVRWWNREMREGEWREERTPIQTRGRAAEPGTWEQLKLARTANQIRKACDASPFWLNCTASPYPFVADLRTNASAFLWGNKYRCPASDRPSSKKKLARHFARVMAGITAGISPARAIDRLRLRPSRKSDPFGDRECRS